METFLKGVIFLIFSIAAIQSSLGQSAAKTNTIAIDLTRHKGRKPVELPMINWVDTTHLVDDSLTVSATMSGPLILQSIKLKVTREDETNGDDTHSYESPVSLRRMSAADIKTEHFIAVGHLVNVQSADRPSDTLAVPMAPMAPQKSNFIGPRGKENQGKLELVRKVRLYQGVNTLEFSVTGMDGFVVSSQRKVIMPDSFGKKRH